MSLTNQNNIKKAVLILIGVVLLAGILFGEEIIAIILPDASDLQMVSCDLDKTVFDYTGEEMKPEVIEVTFENKDGKSIVKTKEEITVVSYQDNVTFGKGDIEIKIKGYSGTALLNDTFLIEPAAVNELNVVQVSEESVQLSWNEVPGASGYYIYRNENPGNDFVLLSQITDGKTFTYQDTAIDFNRIYDYKVCAFAFVVQEDETTENNMSADLMSSGEKKEEETEATNIEVGANEILVGADSNLVTCYTPLATPVLSKVENQTYNSILVQWDIVDGAAGYQVYRSESANGEFTMLTETTDPSILSYTDASCECGKEYFYYVKVCQKLETENIYGKASNIESSKTVPNTVKISGKPNSDTQVNLSWKKSDGAQGYEIYRRVGDSDYQLMKKLENVDELTWSDTGLSKEKEYTYRIRPYCTVNGTTITGSYSNTYVKKAVVEVNSENVSSGTSSNISSSGSASGSFSEITKYVGVPYVSGGTTPSGWDCSGFTQWALKQYFGVSIPRTAASQGSGGKSISVSNRSAWQAGDILAYSNGSRISHVVLYLGNGQIMHALNSKYDTIIQSVDYYESWDSGNYLAAVKRYH